MHYFFSYFLPLSSSSSSLFHVIHHHYEYKQQHSNLSSILDQISHSLCRMRYLFSTYIINKVNDKKFTYMGEKYIFFIFFLPSCFWIFNRTRPFFHIKIERRLKRTFVEISLRFKRFCSPILIN